MPGPHACASASAASGQRTLTACPEDGRLGEGERLSANGPNQGGRALPRASLSPPFQGTRHPAGRASRGASAACPRPHTRSEQAADPGDCLPQGRAAAGGSTPHPTRPSLRREGPCPWHATSSRACRPRGPHTGTPVPTADGQQTPTAPPKDGRPGEGELIPSKYKAPRRGTTYGHPHSALKSSRAFLS